MHREKAIWGHSTKAWSTCRRQRSHQKPTLTLDFQPPLWENTFLLLHHPVCGFLWWKPKVTDTKGRNEGRKEGRKRRQSTTWGRRRLSVQKAMWLSPSVSQVGSQVRGWVGLWAQHRCIPKPVSLTIRWRWIPCIFWTTLQYALFKVWGSSISHCVKGDRTGKYYEHPFIRMFSAAGSDRGMKFGWTVRPSFTTLYRNPEVGCSRTFSDYQHH